MFKVMLLAQQGLTNSNSYCIILMNGNPPKLPYIHSIKFDTRPHNGISFHSNPNHNFVPRFVGSWPVNLMYLPQIKVSLNPYFWHFDQATSGALSILSQNSTVGGAWRFLQRAHTQWVGSLITIQYLLHDKIIMIFFKIIHDILV